MIKMVSMVAGQIDHLNVRPQAGFRCYSFAVYIYLSSYPKECEAMKAIMHEVKKIRRRIKSASDKTYLSPQSKESKFTESEYPIVILLEKHRTQYL